MALYEDTLQREEYARIRANNAMDFLSEFCRKIGGLSMQIEHVEVNAYGGWGNVIEVVTVKNHINRLLLLHATGEYPWRFVANDDMNECAAFLRSVLRHLEGMYSFASDHQDIVIYKHKQP